MAKRRRDEDPLAVAMAESLRRAFVKRAEELYPGLPRGWQSRLEEQTASDPTVALKQPMISQIMNEETKAYRLTTLVRLRNFVGKRLDDILGLPPIDGDKEERKREVREVLREILDETPVPPSTSAVHNKRRK